MGSIRKLRLAVLTSSRADFGIYIPLLKVFKENSDLVSFEIIAFGTHLSKFHGFTKSDILREGFIVNHEFITILTNDSNNSISTAYALTALKFADFWNEHEDRFDYVLCLGDRFEMAAAVAAGVPYNIKYIHLHGGETTLGAIDNIYRHCITLASHIHFVACDQFKDRVIEITADEKNCFVSGALSLDNLESIALLSPEDFKIKWGIDLLTPFVLVTIHPETSDPDSNKKIIEEFKVVITQIISRYNVVITLPNADANGILFRELFVHLMEKFPEKISLIENFGTVSYFTCMKYTDIILGNSSSGIIEAASFSKYVINIGNRQKGRLTGKNVLHAKIDHVEILELFSEYSGRKYDGENPYKKGNAAKFIYETLINKFNATL